MSSEIENGSGPAGDSDAARRGLSWTLSSVTLLAIAQIAYTALTARIVPRAEFGYYASAQAFAALAGYLALGSLGAAVMRHHSGRNLRGAALSLAICAGAVVGGLVALGGGLWAGAWAIPHAADATRLYGLCVALTPVAAVATGLQRRRSRYRHAAAAEFAGTILGFACGAALAGSWHSAAALILGQAAALLVTVVLCLPQSRQGSAPEEPPVTWARLAGFATNVSVQNFVYYLIYNLPPFSISRTLGASALGGYGRANILVVLPLTQLTQSVNKVLYPLWARRSESRRVRDPFTDVLVGTSLIGAVGFGTLAGAATPITRLLLGPAFNGIEDLVRILALFGLVNLSLTIAGSLQEASRWMGDVWRLQALKLAMSSLLLGILVVHDVRYAAGVLVLTQVVGHAYQLVQLGRRGAVVIPRVLRAYLQHAIVAALVCAPLWLVSSVTDNLIEQAGSTLVVGLVAMVALLRAGERLEGMKALLRRDLLPGWLVGTVSRVPR